MQQRVDPFIPVQRQSAAQRKQRPISQAAKLRGIATYQPSPWLKRRPSTSVDGLVHARPMSATPQPRHQAPKPAPTAVPHYPKTTSAPPAGKAKRHRLRRMLITLRLPAAIIATACLGLLLPSQLAGEIAIGMYALFAVIRSVASRTTFALALTALGMIVVALVIQGDDTISQNFAVYAFLLLAVGTISLGLEARRDYA